MQKKLLALGGFAVIVVALVAFTILSSGKSIPITEQLSLPDNYGSAVAYDADNALVAGNNSFFTYNYRTGADKIFSSSAGDSNVLGNADTLSLTQDKQYLLFHLPNTADESVLSGILQSKGMEENADYWWIYDVNSQIYTPLAADTLLAKISGNKVYTLASGENGETITGFRLDTMEQTSSVSIVPSADFFVTKDGYVLQNTDGNIYLTTDGIVNQQLFTKSALVAAGDNHQVVIAQRGNDTITLRSYSMETKKFTTIAGNVSTGVSWNHSGLLLYGKGIDTTKFYTYNMDTKKTTGWNTSKEIHTGGGAVGLLSETAALFNDTSGKVYLASSAALNTPNAPKD